MRVGDYVWIVRGAVCLDGCEFYEDLGGEITEHDVGDIHEWFVADEDGDGHWLSDLDVRPYVAAPAAEVADVADDKAFKLGDGVLVREGAIIPWNGDFAEVPCPAGLVGVVGSVVKLEQDGISTVFVRITPDDDGNPPQYPWSYGLAWWLNVDDLTRVPAEVVS